jgi:hypothetical protein
VSAAAERRIVARVEAAAREDYPHGGQVWAVLMGAIEPEGFARPRGTVEKLIRQWIRSNETPSWLRGVCAGAFDSVCYERHRFQEAGRDLVRGIRTFEEVAP